jgi:RepB DNA-primase from phage plasmid/Relaxase/Mobilisation nuclease domain/Large polyvalent protein-associated domain 7
VIVKKARNPKKSAAKTARVGRLADYIVSPTRAGEKCLYSGGRGFITEDHAGHKAEMLALSQESVRSKDTINHYVLSWREGEQPNPAQVEQAVTIFMDELGLRDHQAIYGLHVDTQNVHLHIAINRVHPDTGKVVEINKGFDLEAAHRGIARIEHAQGWQREKNGRYQVLETGALGRASEDENRQRQPAQRKRDMENRTGEKSAERIAIEEAGSILKGAASWEELHRQLAEKGMRYERVGSGAKVFVGDVPVKASDVDRSASLKRMQERLGVYERAGKERPNEYFTHAAREPDLGDARNTAEDRLRNLSECRLAYHEQGRAEGVLQIDASLDRRPAEGVRRAPGLTRGPEPLEKNAPGWDAYIAGRRAHYEAKNAVGVELSKRQGEERGQLAERQRADRDRLLQGDWRGRGAVCNAMRSVTAAEQAAEKAAMRERHQQERQAMRQRFGHYPDFEQWQRQRERPDLAEQWRHRANEPQWIEGGRTDPPTPRDIRDFVPSVVGGQVHYTRRDDAGPDAAFIDYGKRIAVHDWRSRETALAAMQLAAQKWGRFTVNGSDDYKALCVKLAAEHGFKLENPELQTGIEQEKSRIQQEKTEGMKSEQLRQFERYHEAVGADRYRVTSIKMRGDGTKQTFILDKRDGVTRGFTPQEIEQRTAEMQRLQRRGENLYYTPLSDGKHHILIDDMDRKKLERLIADGYKPAVVIESSPGNYQAIITVRKLGTAHDRDVGNRLAERLNREYGDAKLSGCIHPHRAPGYENRKPKHQREDGSYPDVRLLRAERRECEATLALSAQIDADYARQAEQKARQPERMQKPVLGDAEVAAASSSAVNAYQRHYRDVLDRQQGGAVDLSRVDSMIAVRMRVTGHSQAEIAGAVRQCAPGIRPEGEARNWDDYAQRTARYAYSAAGDRQVAALDKYNGQWMALEGRMARQGLGREREGHAAEVERENGLWL